MHGRNQMPTLFDTMVGFRMSCHSISIRHGLASGKITSTGVDTVLCSLSNRCPAFGVARHPNCAASLRDVEMVTKCGVHFVYCAAGMMQPTIAPGHFTMHLDH